MARVGGMARAEAIVLSVGIGAVGVAGAAWVTPRVINAAQAGGRSESLVEDDRCSALRLTLERAQELLGAWEAPGGASLDFVVWYRDADMPGVINASELVLFSFNRSLGRLSSFTLEADASKKAAEEMGLEVVNESSVGPDPAHEVVSRRSLNERFPWSWRAREGVVRVDAAIGLQDLTLTASSGGSRLGDWRLRLVWPPQASDELEAKRCEIRIAAR
jgi:hypothetical protein